MTEEYIIYSFPLLYSHLKSLECGKGWYRLIYNLSKELEEIIQSTAWEDEDRPYVTQVKAKYGTLRFYMTYLTDEMDELIEKAEEESASICERCGKPGELFNRFGIMYTWCLECRQDPISNVFSSPYEEAK